MANDIFPFPCDAFLWKYLVLQSPSFSYNSLKRCLYIISSCSSQNWSLARSWSCSSTLRPLGYACWSRSSLFQVHRIRDLTKLNVILCHNSRFLLHQAMLSMTSSMFASSVVSLHEFFIMLLHSSGSIDIASNLKSFFRSREPFSFVVERKMRMWSNVVHVPLAITPCKLVSNKA